MLIFIQPIFIYLRRCWCLAQRHQQRKLFTFAPLVKNAKSGENIIQMKRLLLIFTLFITASAFAQNANPDAILHKWVLQDKTGIIYFRKSGNAYEAVQTYGRRVLEADGKTYKKDVNNPDPSLRGRRLVNYVFIKNLVFKDGKWTDGKLYNYEDGNYYDATITIKANVLYMRVYKGIYAFGKTIKWDMIE